MAVFEYGTPARFREDERSDGYELLVVGLHWHALRLEGLPEAEITRWMAQAREPGVYAYEAWIDSQGARSIVYVGESERPIAQRWAEDRSSLGFIIDSRFEPWSDVSDVCVRWAKLDAEHIAAVEAVLIAAHAPAFNSQRVRRDLRGDPAAERLVVMNVGNKGRLLPIVAGSYYSTSRALWPAPPLNV